MIEKTVTVSVIIPTYNRAHTVSRAIQSVLNQTYQDFEIIVVDDCSTDNTEEVVKGFNDSRICYIRHEQNRGGSAARNTGIRIARGEYIAFLDSDDEWLPNKLAEQMRVFYSDRNCGAVYTDLLHVCKDGHAEVHKGYHPEGWILKDLLVTNVVGSASSVVVKRECFKVVGLFDEKLPSCQDWDMWIRIAKHYTFRSIPEPLVKYLWHQEQISTNFEAVWRGHMAIMRKYQVDICALGRYVESLHHFRIGNYLCHAGEMRLGRQRLFLAVIQCPWRIKYSIYALASLFGASGFQRLISAKRILGKVLNLLILCGEKIGLIHTNLPIERSY